MYGIKHLVQCHCVLPQYRKMRNPIFHKFVVFSVIGDDDIVIPKTVECNNCGAVHKVTEIEKSEIVIGRDGLPVAMTKEDFKINLPANISDILENYSVDLPTWEEVSFSLDNGMWGKEILLKKEKVGEEVQGKVMQIIGPTQVKIASFSRSDEVK